MDIGLGSLFDEGSVVHVEESRMFNAAKEAAGGQRGPFLLFIAVDIRIFPESIHAFTSHPTAMATAAFDGVEAWLASRLTL
jgi:hypothetical protein